MTIYKSINNVSQNIITLPSGHYCSYQLSPEIFNNRIEFVVLSTNIHELIEMQELGKTYCLSEPEDSITLEGTKIIFS